MTIDQLRELIQPLDGDEDIQVVMQCDAEESAEDGDVLRIKDTGFVPTVGHVLYVEPK